MTGLSLRNPIAVLMAAIGLVVFAAVVTPRMSVDTFPELTPAGAGGRDDGAGPRPQGRREDAQLADREVRQRHPRRRSRRERLPQQPQRRLRLAQVGHRPQRRADAGAAAGRLRHVGRPQVAGRAAAVRAAVRSLERAGRPGGGGGRRPHRTAALRLRAQQHRAGAGGDPRRRQRLASTAAASARSTWSSIRCKAQARGITSTDVAAAVHDSNALLPSGEFISPKFDANVYTNAVPGRVRAIGDAVMKTHDGALGPDPGRGAGRRRRRPGDAVGLGRGRRTPST